MSTKSGSVPGETVHACGVAVAGCLAELGVQQLAIASGDLHVEVQARITNLPALIEQAMQLASQRIVRIEAGALGAVFELRGESPCHATWSCGDPHAAARIQACLMRR